MKKIKIKIAHLCVSKDLKIHYKKVTHWITGGSCISVAKAEIKAKTARAYIIYFMP